MLKNKFLREISLRDLSIEEAIFSWRNKLLEYNAMLLFEINIQQTAVEAINTSHVMQ